MTIGNLSNENDVEIDRHRIDLFNDPNYGVVLCLMEKYRSLLDLPTYPFELFEEHLVRNQEENSSRLIDFHFMLLKRLSLAKNAQRDKFDSIITRFVSRYDTNDSEHLTTTGYLRSDIHLKLRILKNLFESQFDLNQTFRTTLNDQSSREIKSFPFGRDRFGVSYWFFMDKNCSVRLFREDVDIDRTWSVVAKNRDELEKFIKLLVTDSTVRKKFPDWTIDDEPFSSLSFSTEFEGYYSPIPMNVEEKEIEVPIKRKRGRPRGSGTVAIIQKEERQIVTRSSNKRRHSDDETSVDDLSLAIRSQKVSTSKTKPKKTKVSKYRRRRRQSTSSSDDAYTSDDYFSQPDTDDHFFELDDEENQSIDDPIRPAKTAHTSTVHTACYVCMKSDRPEVLLLCDDCDDAYHLECLRPILLSVPDGDWFCPLCEQKKLANCLIEKFKEIEIHYQQMKKISEQSNIPKKDYSMTASESELENDQQSIVSTSQINENSNFSSSSYMDENISQRGRRRRTRFDMKKILDNYYSDSNDDQQITDFQLQLPKKITRLLHRHERSEIHTEQQIKTLPTRLDYSSLDSNDPSELNEKLGSPIVYVSHSRSMKSVITNSKQTSQIVRRWNDVQRRSRLKINFHLGLDDTSLLHSTNEDQILSHLKINSIQPTTTCVPVDQYLSRNGVQKVDANFDRITRDIQLAVNEAHLLPTMTITSDQQQIKRIPKKRLSPFTVTNPFPTSIPDMCNIFQSKDYSTSNSTDLSTVILTPSSSSSILDATDDSTTPIIDT